MQFRYTWFLLALCFIASVQQTIAQPAPSVSMLLNSAGKDSVSITLKFTNNNVMWNCEGIQATVAYEAITFIPYEKSPRHAIHGIRFAQYNWQDFSNPFLEMDGGSTDLMGYGEAPTSGSITIGANQTFNLCRMNFQPTFWNASGTTSFSYSGNTGSAGSTGYLWVNDPDLRAFATATGLNNVPYPVEFSVFNAEIDGNTVVLHWTTESETNNSGFNIERRESADGFAFSDWKTIGFVRGKGTTTQRTQYMSIDLDEHASAMYQYRLRQIDHDGTFDYSTVASVDFRWIADGYELAQNYPNPFGTANGVRSTSIQFTIPNRAERATTPVRLAVYDMLGREVEVVVNELKSPGKHTVRFFAGALPAGQYVYELRHGSTRISRLFTIVDR